MQGVPFIAINEISEFLWGLILSRIRKLNFWIRHKSFRIRHRSIQVQNSY